ncbi:hypothetical protein GDO86_013156 [Hymenochirus boettgeri]|uniref:Uncharacterized protein n=1 Tax=Hymenochirus boettgeri TaxID=247094 RepID=A0A8T2IVL2_9PIPI|nr:hypothetical protein GDO86_013156 [Hymenochirus boettgeri]
MFNRTISYIYLKNTYKSKCFDTKIFNFTLFKFMFGFKHAVITVFCYKHCYRYLRKGQGCFCPVASNLPPFHIIPVLPVVKICA